MAKKIEGEKYDLSEVDASLCRKDVDSDRCFLKHPVYAHSTSMDRADKIAREGLTAMPVDKRVHKRFDPVHRDMCIEKGVYDRVCRARSKNVYLWADLYGAIDHLVYMGGLVGLDFKDPAVVLVDVGGKKVETDIENMLHLAEEDEVPIDEIVKKNPDDSLPVMVEGPIPPDNVLCVCGLTKSAALNTVPKLDQKVFEYPEDFGFDFDPKEHGVEDDTDEYYDAYDRELDKFLIEKESGLKPHFSDFIKSIKDSEGDFFDFTDNVVHDRKNWECKCKKKIEKK